MSHLRRQPTTAGTALLRIACALLLLVVAGGGAGPAADEAGHTSDEPHARTFTSRLSPALLVFVAAAFTPPTSSYFPDPAHPFQAFDLPLATATGLVGNATSLNIAVGVICSASSPGITVPYLNSTLLTTGSTDDFLEFFAQAKAMVLTPEQVMNDCQTGLGLYDDFYRSFLLFQDRVNNQCNGGVPGATASVGECGVPTSSYASNGMQLRARVNIVYFNIGPLTTSAADSPYLVQTVTNAGLLASLLTTEFSTELGYLLGHFPILIPPPYGGDTVMELFASACELTKTCIVVTAYGGSSSLLKCVDQYLLPELTEWGCPVECSSCRSQRRYKYTFNYLYSQLGATGSLDTQLKMKGAKSVALFSGGKSTLDEVIMASIADMAEKGLDVVWTGRTPWTYTQTLGDVSSGALTAATILPYAEQIMALNPDVVILLSDSSAPDDMTSFTNLIVAFKNANWLPRALVGAAGSWGALPDLVGAQTGDMTDGGLMYGAAVNDFRIRTSSYQTVPNPTNVSAYLTYDSPNYNWEPYPNTIDPDDPSVTDYGAAVLRKAYIAAFNDTTPAMLNGYTIPQVATTMLVMATKLLELAGTDDPALLQAASYQISAPSVGGLIQFDTMGRLVMSDQFVIQVGSDGVAYNLITPLDVGVADTYPLPTWDERVFKGETLSATKEKVVVAINTLCIAFLIALAVALFSLRAHPVIKASSAPFCVLTLTGAIICLCSNYCTSLYPTVAACAANVWFLTTGFTIMFCSLLAKTFRVWRIFAFHRLTTVRITSTTLGLYVALALAVDVIINASWSIAAPFGTEIVVVDAVRPMYNYLQCDYNSTARAFMYVQVAWKSIVILAAVVLTVLTRNLPSAFNESSYLTASIYNVTVLIIFLVPIIGTGTGTRTVQYILRNYGLMVLCTSSMAILYLPKLLLVWSMQARNSVVLVSTLPGKPQRLYRTPSTPYDASAPIPVHDGPVVSGAAAASRALVGSTPTGTAAGRGNMRTSVAVPHGIGRPIAIAPVLSDDAVLSCDQEDDDDGNSVCVESEAPDTFATLRATVAGLRAANARLRARLAQAQAMWETQTITNPSDSPLPGEVIRSDEPQVDASST